MLLLPEAAATTTALEANCGRKQAFAASLDVNDDQRVLKGKVISTPVPFYPSLKIELSMGKGCCFCVWVVEPSPCTASLSTGASMLVLFWLMLFILFG
jgi:hypothetical protein